MSKEKNIKKTIRNDELDERGNTGETESLNEAASAVNEADTTEGLQQAEADKAEASPGEDENGSLQNELEETKDRLLRLHAEFDNYRKRTQREKEEWYQYASMGLIEKLLPVVDNFERALDSLKNQSEEVQGMLAGIEMIYRQLMEILQKEGLEPISAAGEIFDPNLHEAMMQVAATEGQQDGQIVEELRKGYCFKNKVLRPTLAKVAKV